jgi:hypothetical protein
MSILSLIPVFFVLILVVPAAWALSRVYRSSRQPREITCPDAGQGATIQLDARNAIGMHALGDPRRRIQACSLWPERQGCAQHCVR